MYISLSLTSISPLFISLYLPISPIISTSLYLYTYCPIFLPAPDPCPDRGHYNEQQPDESSNSRETQ